MPGRGSPSCFHWMIRSAMSVWAARCSFWLSRGVSVSPRHINMKKFGRIKKVCIFAA